MVDIEYVKKNDELMVLSATGKVIWIESNQVSSMGRSTRGVKIMGLESDDYLVAVAKPPLLEE